MAILIDFNQICISNIMVHLATTKTNQVEIDLCRHMVLNSIRNINTMFKRQYGEIILCCDDKKDTWRRQIYPFYKQKRRTGRSQDGFDWPNIFSFLEQVKQELKETFPYKVLQIDHAEGDDIIGTLTKHFNQNGEKVKIVSGDKDFIQLQNMQGVSQFDPIRKRDLILEDHNSLHIHIIKGDQGDGIPNCLSDDDTFINSDKRQKKLTKKIFSQLVETPVIKWTDKKAIAGYKRNLQLIDLNYIPQDVQQQIVDQYINYVDNDRSKLFNYFVKHQLRQLIDAIGEF